MTYLLISLLLLASCRATDSAIPTEPQEKENRHMKTSKLRQRVDPEHSPNTLIIMYDEAVGNAPLLAAVKAFGATLIYDYGKAHGIAIRKPDSKTLDETIAYFKQVKGVTHVERDRIVHLTDPIRKSPRNVHF